jgi:IS5 family transposase
MGHALIENRHGLVVAAAVSKAGGAGERNAALTMIERRADRAKRITLGADKGYDDQDFVNELRSMAVTPHVARKARHSAIDKRTARHAGYATSQRRRKMVEEAFGWAKTIGGLTRVKLRGLSRIRYQFTFAMAAYNLIRMPKLLAAK